MANLSNINNKFLFTDGDFLKIGNLAPINNISGTESGISITNGNCASITLDNSAPQGKTFSIYSAVNGSLNFFDVDAASGRLIIDTAGDVGIGISPGENLHIFKSDATALIQASNTSGIAQLQFFPRDSSNVAHLQSIKGVDTSLTFLTGGNSGNSYVPTERMRITSAGDVLFSGKTALSLGTIGAELRANGQCLFVADGDNAVDLNRLTNDGAIALFRKDGSVIGSIGSNTSGGNPLLDIAGATGSSNIRFLTTNTERVRIENTGVMKFANTATSTGDVGTIAHYTNNYMYIRGGTGGLAIGDDGFDVSIYLNNNDSMSLNTAGVQKMRINSQGQTWIGGGSYTGSDIANGNTSYLNSLNAGTFSILHRNSSDAYVHFNSYYTSSNTYVSKYTGIGFMVGVNAAANNGMFFSKAPSVSAGAVQTYETGIMQIGYGANNYVGIGTVSPAAKLEITGTIEGRYLQVDAIAGFAGISSSMGAMVEFFNSGDGNNVKIKTNNSTRTDAAPFSVWTDANSRFIIRNDGNVGIGDSSPASKLVVAGRVQANSGSEPWAFVSNPTSGNYGGFLMQYGNNTKGVCYYNSNSIIVGSEGAAIPLRLTTNGNYVAHFSGTTGNMHVGGISDQDAKLYVTGGTTLAGASNTSEGAIRMYGDRKLPQATNFVRRNYNLTAGSSGALYSIARQWHDHANWGVGNINVIMWGIYYGQGQFNKADFSCRYGYSGGGADVQTNFNTNNMTQPAWTAATQVSGNIHYRDLQIQIPAYYQISFEIISPGCLQTYNVNNTANNTVYLYPH
jgi:hypothetical protein